MLNQQKTENFWNLLQKAAATRGQNSPNESSISMDSSRRLLHATSSYASLAEPEKERQAVNKSRLTTSTLDKISQRVDAKSPSESDKAPTSCSTPSRRGAKLWNTTRNKLRAHNVVKGLGNQLIKFGTGKQLLDINKRGAETVRKTLDPTATPVLQPEMEWCILYPENVFMEVWSCIIILLLLYTATIMPYKLAFMDDTTLGWYVADLCVDCLFMCDVLINLNLAYADENGKMVTSRKTIFLNYLGGWLILDILLSIPMGPLENAFFKGTFDPRMLRLIRLPRLYRLLRFNKLFGMSKFFKKSSFFDQIEDFLLMNPGFARFISFIATVLTCTHIIGCMWCYCANLYMYGPDTWVARFDMQDFSNGELYLASIYWAMQTLLTVGYGDMAPYTELEIILTILWMTFGAGVFSYSIGNLSTVMSNLDSQSSSLALKLENLNTFCRDMKIDKELRDELKKDIEYRTRNGMFSMMEKQSVLLEMPQHIKSEVLLNYYLKR